LKIPFSGGTNKQQIFAKDVKSDNEFTRNTVGGNLKSRLLVIPGESYSATFITLGFALRCVAG